ncbi:MAG TPA: hypothetical protein VLZ03_05030 [Thermodesulfobacteriota bacterium]|nr:hypothetical protein [Thermodesulfobacteriota bacterium]
MKKVVFLLVTVLAVAVIAIPTLSKADGAPVQIGGPVAGGYYSPLQPSAQYSGDPLPVTPVAGGYYGPLKPLAQYSGDPLPVTPVAGGYYGPLKPATTY